LTAFVLYLFRGTDDGLDDTIEAADETLASIQPADITTPPTIAAPTPSTRPPATAPEASGDTSGDGGVLAGPPETAPPLTLPSFDLVAGYSADQLPPYDLTAAAAANVRGELPMRTVYTVSGLDMLVATQPGEPDVRVTAASVPATGLDSLRIETGPVANEVVVDRAAGVVYGTQRDSGSDPTSTRTVQWSPASVDQSLSETGAASIDALFDSMVTGPITPTTLATARVTPTDELVRMAGGAFARRYDVVIPTERLLPVGGLLFADVSNYSITNDLVPPAIRFQVYVTDQPAIALVVSLFEIDGTPRLFTQYFDRLPANVNIELPPTDEVVQEGGFGQPDAADSDTADATAGD
jgi:hypothetical protein